MSNETQKPTSHGVVEPAVVDYFSPKRRPLVPRFLRTYVINLPYDEAATRYGLWKVRLLRDILVLGRPMKTGDTVTIPGNYAAEIVGNGGGVFDDPKLEEEREILAKAEKIKSGTPVRDMPEFQQQQPKRKPGFIESVFKG